MSDSRLEKFIYAICSMEVSNLPAPLSRIEKLWNCLITGEIPDFEPQSRNEKYLMAMIGSYDISNLPTPMSRGEKLLYKIAVGETDLSDVPGYLSRYEELLKYLIENGGIGGGNFEYVLHTLNQSLSTLYNTAEKPVKSAILSGQTLMNIKGEISNDLIVNNQSKIDFLIPSVKKNTDYLIKYDTILVGKSLAIGFLKDATSWSKNLENQPNTGIFKMNSGKNPNYFRIITANTITVNNLMIIEYQEGMENWDIPYFEGMQSVKMPVLTTTGKNLFNSNNTMDGYGFSVGEVIVKDTFFISDYIEVKPNLSYIISASDNSVVGRRVNFYDKDKNFVETCRCENLIITVPNNNKIFYIRTNADLSIKSSYQIEQGTVATSYEPYKTNILTVNEPIELRGIGDVQDTLDCLTGELTQRIGEVVLNGSENWQEYNTNVANTYCGVIRNDVITDYKGTVYLNNKLNKLDDSDVDIEGIRINSSKRIFVRLNRDKGITDLTTFKQYLSQNPITIQYEMIAESIKTVDLITVDQDGQPTELKTFNNITHVEIKANNLIPSVDLEVATKISQTLSTIGPQQLDISETQNKLGQTIDEQTANTDATMMATTEIYEQTL